MEGQFDGNANEVFGVVTLTGEFTVESFREFYEQLLNDPNFRSGMNLLWDTRKVCFQSLTPESLRLFQGYIISRLPRRGKSRSAVVIDEDYAFGMMRMFEQSNENMIPIQFQVYRDVHPAREWLTRMSGGPQSESIDD